MRCGCAGACCRDVAASPSCRRGPVVALLRIAVAFPGAVFRGQAPTLAGRPSLAARPLPSTLCAGAPPRLCRGLRGPCCWPPARPLLCVCEALVARLRGTCWHDDPPEAACARACAPCCTRLMPDTAQENAASGVNRCTCAGFAQVWKDLVSENKNGRCEIWLAQGQAVPTCMLCLVSFTATCSQQRPPPAQAALTLSPAAVSFAAGAVAREDAPHPVCVLPAQPQGRHRMGPLVLV